MWIPIRTRIGSLPGQSNAASSCCACAAAATASGAVENTTKKLSPSVPISVPPWVPHAFLSTLRWASNASAYAGPRRLSSRVDPSMSENNIVTVPVGNSTITT